MKDSNDPALAAQRRRNLWLGLALFGFVVLVGVSTAIRLQDAALTDDNSFYFNGSMSVPAVSGTVLELVE